MPCLRPSSPADTTYGVLPALIDIERISSSLVVLYTFVSLFVYSVKPGCFTGASERIYLIVPESEIQAPFFDGVRVSSSSQSSKGVKHENNSTRVLVILLGSGFGVIVAHFDRLGIASANERPSPVFFV